jgi:hypothetical protein
MIKEKSLEIWQNFKAKMAEGVVRKLNSVSPTLIELKFREFNPP